MKKGKTGSIYKAKIFIKCQEYSKENNFKHMVKRPNVILYHESILLMYNVF